MAAPTSSPLTILFCCPPDGPPAAESPLPRGLIGGGREFSELLCAEVAACVAAVGYRLRVVSRAEALAGVQALGLTPGSAPAPAVVVWGLAPGEPPPGGPGPENLPEHLQEGVQVIPVALYGTSASPGVVALPHGARDLCGTLASAALPRGGDCAAGQGLVLVHQGDGPEGDGRWPGLAWALTLLGGGRGRGILVDAQGPAGSLSARLRDLAPPGPGRVGWQGTGGVPVPGPALMARLPGAGGVRWWGWGSTSGPEGGSNLWDEWGPCLEAARAACPWTVVDVGRDLDRAGEAAAGGTPVVLCTDREPSAASLSRPEVVLRTPGRDGTSGRSRAPGGSRVTVPSQRTVGEVPVPFRAEDWSGTSLAAWDRAARRRAGHRLAAELRVRLDRPPRSSAAGALAGRVSP